MPTSSPAKKTPSSTKVLNRGLLWYSPNFFHLFIKISSSSQSSAKKQKVFKLLILLLFSFADSCELLE